MKINIENTFIIDEARATVKKRNLSTITATFIFVYLFTALLTAFIYSLVLFIQGGFTIESLKAGVSLMEQENSSWYEILRLVINIIAIIIPIYYCTKLERRRVFTLGFIKKGFVSEYSMGLVIGTAMFSVAFGIIYLLGGFEQLDLTPSPSVGFIILAFIGYIIQGMSEEVLIRGYYMVSAATAGNLPLAIFSSSFIFALLHIGNDGLNAIGFINIFLFGIFAALYFIRRGSIWGIAAMHTAWNFAQGNIFGCAVSGNTPFNSVITFNESDKLRLINGGEFGPEGGLAVTIVLIAGIIILYLMKNKLQKCKIE